MIVSEQWIREWVDPALEREALLEQLTMAGLEVDAWSPVAADFTDVVVAEILSAEPHPEADRLQVCQVSDGLATLQIVCGASNARAGLKVPLARVGALLPAVKGEGSPLRIKQARLRGVESNGMLCSAAELGLAESADGLLELSDEAVPGTDIRDFLDLDDISIELDLTPNRGDCLSVRGLSREVAVLNAMTCTAPPIKPVAAQSESCLPIEIRVPQACPRYLGRVIEGIAIDAETPQWMQEKLRRCGLRSIDPVVDVTNYVLLELGQPMHAFDLDQLTGGICVRMAEAGEKLVLLDGKQLSLERDTMIIADHDKALALAGIMGGMASAVSSATRNIFLECAFFSPLAVAGKARSYGLHTDSSHRYERGVDPELQALAMERATELLLAIAGGRPGPVTGQTGQLPDKREVSLQFASIEKILGIALARERVLQILQQLGLDIVSQDERQVTLGVPSWRFDIEMEVDLIEELARIHGYDKLPKARNLAGNRLQAVPESEIDPARIKDRLVALGYQEVITYSFVEPEIVKLLTPQIEAVSLQNPISSEMSIMRTSLLPGLLNTLKYNLNRQHDRVRLFESGLVFLPKERGIEQPMRVAGLLYGSRLPEQWGQNRETVDFFDLKGDVESLFDLGRKNSCLEFSSVAAESVAAAFHPGQCAELLMDGEHVGLLGALNPKIQRQLDIPARVFLFEVSFDALRKALLPAFQELSRFPEVNRDLAIIVDQEVKSSEILSIVRQNAGNLLTNAKIFDVYQGNAIGKEKKSIALGLTLQHPSRTLGDDDINGIINSCVKELEDKFNAKLRN
ncbi:MAG: phenylalanine--tRNA ligase subunit beta [Pseudomonadales bacterium]|nr:phenylalanine--tRNA ligase subunit beta [Pseudomonadales bacterium]